MVVALVVCAAVKPVTAPGGLQDAIQVKEPPVTSQMSGSVKLATPQIGGGDVFIKWGVGLTLTARLVNGPLQLFKTGVIAYVTVAVPAVEFVSKSFMVVVVLTCDAVKPVTAPGGDDMAAHANPVLAWFPVRVTAKVEPEQIGAGWLFVSRGTGSTSALNWVRVALEQPAGLPTSTASV